MLRGTLPDQTLLIEYKPFEPAFYHTDVADWGMALHLATQTGPQAKMLVDTEAPLQFQNIEQIVAWLLDEVGWEAFISMTAAMRTMTHPGIHRSLSGIPHLSRNSRLWCRSRLPGES